MIKAAIVGCGKIADAHAWAISSTPGAELAAVCDSEGLMALQLAERFGVRQRFDEVGEMLAKARPDVVHITTPPPSHFTLARTVLEAGCSVYVEKPFTLRAAEAEELIRLAEVKGLKLTVGTDEQFSPAAVEMRRLVASGGLGGRPVHMDAYYCYDLGDERYAKAFLENQSHWLRQLPGGLLQNIISHGIAKIAEFLDGDEVSVTARGFVGPLLRGAGEKELIDELRVIIRDRLDTTAYFTFSTRMKPLLREFRVYGPKNGLILDQDHHCLIRLPGGNYKSYLDKVLPLNYAARQYRKGLFKNVGLFLRREFNMKQGLKNLVQAFYGSIADGTPPPIPYREILLTARIMDDIFEQTSPKR